jgi:hypothetical protein
MIYYHYFILKILSVLCHFERSEKSQYKFKVIRFLVALLCRNDNQVL